MHGAEKTKLKDEKLALWECDLTNMETDADNGWAMANEEFGSDDDHVNNHSLAQDIEAIDKDDKKIKLKIRRIVNKKGVPLAGVKKTVGFKKSKNGGRSSGSPPMNTMLSHMATNMVSGKNNDAVEKESGSDDQLQEDPCNLDIVKTEAPVEEIDDDNDTDDSIEVLPPVPQKDDHHQAGGWNIASQAIDFSIAGSGGDHIEVSRAANIPSYADIVQRKVKLSPGHWVKSILTSKFHVQVTNASTVNLPQDRRPPVPPRNAININFMARNREDAPSTSGPADLSSVPLFDIRTERDQLAQQLMQSLQRNNELTCTLLNMAKAFNKMEERIRTAERELDSHSLAISNMQRRLHHEDRSTMPGYVESLIINPDPTKLLKIVRSGDIFQLAKNELIFGDSLLMMTFRISTIILDILR